jgi:DNA-binding response OmpR family regulator
MPSDAVRILVRRGRRTGGLRVTVDGAGAASAVPVLVRALRAWSASRTVAGLRLFPDSRTLTRDGRRVPVTRREFDLLLFLVQHPRRVFTRLQLLSAVWGNEYTSERTIDVHIGRLRAKTGQPLVVTVYRVGYRLHEATVAVVVRTS